MPLCLLAIAILSRLILTLLLLLCSSRNMSLAFDENGRPFIILREQEKKKRVKGLEAHKVSTITLRDFFERLLQGLCYAHRLAHSSNL